MMSFLAKAAFAGFMTALVTVIAKKSAGWGGLLTALPLTSLLAFAILYYETREGEKVAELSNGVLAFIIPSIPFFIILPMLIRSGMNFWLAYALGILLLLTLYALTFWMLPKFGVQV